jgi:exonuclease SbcC
MRVLTIRGENLASLGQPFSIDFESEPLAGTGLFAITGETGSGKSTILDALCLALYGAYPRFAEQHQDALPDPSGMRAAVADGGTILRRGAGNGHAEVEFVGQDGLRYRARWEARRAYGRPNGTVQGANRTLHQVDGDTLIPIAHTKTTVQKAVDTQVGLSFEQFCRTVLLPQGEFDAFLLAERAERGALLEKLTGTEIYGRISTIVFNGTRKLRDDATALETRLTNLGLLPTEERESIEQAIAALKLEVETKTGEQQALQARITHLENLTQAQ